MNNAEGRHNNESAIKLDVGGGFRWRGIDDKHKQEMIKYPIDAMDRHMPDCFIASILAPFGRKTPNGGCLEGTVAARHKLKERLGSR